MQEINTVWESFEVINFYSMTIHSLIKQNEIPLPTINNLTIDSSQEKRTISKDRIYGTLSHIKDKKNPRTALIEATLIFEAYISDVILMVYLDYPRRALAADAANENQTKLTEIILSSDSKEEIIDRLLEEKIRGIFYGSVADIFQKDRAKVELKDTFKNEKGRKLIDEMLEILARRNIYIHNAGKVDRKYLRETKKDVQLGTVLSISENYIKNAINVFSEIATMFTVAILKNIYKIEPKSNALQKTYWHD